MIREERKAHTHIRRDYFSTHCGLFNSSYGTISGFHYLESFKNEAIAGQINRLPEPLCVECEDRAKWVYRIGQSQRSDIEG